MKTRIFFGGVLSHFSQRARSATQHASTRNFGKITAIENQGTTTNYMPTRRMNRSIRSGAPSRLAYLSIIPKLLVEETFVESETNMIQATHSTEAAPITAIDSSSTPPRWAWANDKHSAGEPSSPPAPEGWV